MSETTYNVRVWKTYVYKGKKTTTYWVRWIVAGRKFKEPFKTVTLADSFRSDLVAAARKGEAFYVDTALPVSMRRAENDMAWYTFAIEYADLKWKRAAGNTRRTNAEALTKLTVAMISGDKGRPDAKLIRYTLNRWAFNSNKREHCPPEVKAVLRWLERNTRRVSAVAKLEVLRAMQDGLLFRLDGGRSAPSVVDRQQSILNACLGYAVQKKIIATNPLPELKKSDPIPSASMAIDRRAVPNPVQVRTLLEAVREGPCGDRLVAFFGCLYFSALRPEEAVGLYKHNLAIPKSGWGDLHLDEAEPHVGKEWTDSGTNRERRQLKQRAVGEGRTVPCPPELTMLLNEHIDRFGFAPDGRLFVGERNRNELPKGTINRSWRLARSDAFTPEVQKSPLAGTPYDLRHAGISFWLTMGIPPADVAKWAGHSIEILFRIYAAWLANNSQLWRNRIDEGLGHA